MFLVIILHGGCNSTTETAANQYAEVFEKLSLPLSQTRSVILVLPNSGCTGCINEAETFMTTHIDEQLNLYAVFTTFNSLKAINIRFGEQLTNWGGKRIFLDTANHITKAGLASVYPVVCLVEDGRVRRAIPLNASGESPLDQAIDFLAGTELKQ